MKTIQIPIKLENLSKFLILFRILIRLIFFGASVGVIWGIINFNWWAITIFSLVSLSCYWVSDMADKYELLFLPKDIFKEEKIYNIDDRGFCIVNGDVKKQIYWNQIIEVDLTDNKYTYLNENYKSFQFQLNQVKSVEIESFYENWYKLLQILPKYSQITPALMDHRKEIFKHLSTCKVCGKAASYKRKCLNCGCDIFDPKINTEFKNETEYIKAEQIHYFGCEMENGQVDFFRKLDNGFGLDQAWKPIIREEDVLKKYHTSRSKNK